MPSEFFFIFFDAERPDNRLASEVSLSVRAHPVGQWIEIDLPESTQSLLVMLDRYYQMDAATQSQKNEMR